jgi:alpha-aminoadipate/glutamate carrier protein LysW
VRYIIRSRAREATAKEALPVVRCPDCDTEIDVDEDEVEEGEILSCPECDVELEVTQVHPVHVIVLSEEEDEDEDEEEDEKEGNGDHGEVIEEDGVE